MDNMHTDKVIQALRPLSSFLLKEFSELKDLPTQKETLGGSGSAPRQQRTRPDFGSFFFLFPLEKGKQYSVHHRLHLVVFRS